MSLPIGEVVDDKYRVLERLGAGGMGEVYKVEHVYLRATRVIKVIRPQISETADAHDRFLREAQLATKVQHPNVATLHDFSALPDGSHYMVWEYIEGENLAQLIRRRGVLPPAAAIRVTRQALAGLEAIHRAGIIHRDISPENLMITDGNVKIIDLGVAKAEQGDYATTQTGMFLGKLRYSSPEQLGFLPPGEKIDPRADLYSLGVVLFEMITGRPPFEATSPHQYFLQHSGGANVQPIDLTLLPNELRPVVAKALERDRNRRFASARQFGEALETPATIRTEIRAAPPNPKRQTGLLVTIVLLVLAFGALATWRYRSKPATVVTNKTEVQKQPATTTTVEVTPAPAPAPEPVTVAPPPSAAHAAEGRGATQKTAPAVQTYVDGGNSSSNDAAVAFAQEKLRGVTRVALDMSDPELRHLIRRSSLTIADDANIVIHFNGTVRRLRFGRKIRQANASITKNGQTIFRYELGPEEYRVGDNPAEAFARVLRDVFGR